MEVRNSWLFLYFNVMDVGVDTLTKDGEVIRRAALYLFAAQTEMIHQIVLAYSRQIWLFLACS